MLVNHCSSIPADLVCCLFPIITFNIINFVPGHNNNNKTLKNHNEWELCGLISFLLKCYQTELKTAILPHTNFTHTTTTNLLPATTHKTIPEKFRSCQRGLRLTSVVGSSFAPVSSVSLGIAHFLRIHCDSTNLSQNKLSYQLWRSSNWFGLSMSNGLLNALNQVTMCIF